jgi:CRP-like cAMP-binding protein
MKTDYNLTMLNKLKSVLASYSTFSEQQLHQIVSCFKPVSVQRNEIILRAGEICEQLYFVYKGCLRIYFINKEGFEKTRQVILEDNLGSALTSFITQKPSIEFIDAQENSELLAVSHKDFYNLLVEIVEWKALYQQILEMAYVQQSRKVEALMTLNAKQRYEKLLKGNPVLIQRLSNRVLASFLDMREETLSRIKSEIRF